MPRVYTIAPAAKVWDSDKEYTNFDVKPMKFRTENDLRRYCRAKGLKSGALL